MGAVSDINSIKLSFKASVKSALSILAAYIDGIPVIGALTGLTTTAKSSAVAAINELDAELNAIKAVTAITGDVALTAAQSGGIFTVGVDEKTITLPSTAKGLRYTIVNTGAAANNIIAISPAAADGIAGTFTLASSVVVADGTVNKDIINTKATANPGDYVTLFGTGTAGTTAWIILGSSGIWAREE